MDNVKLYALFLLNKTGRKIFGRNCIPIAEPMTLDELEEIKETLLFRYDYTQYDSFLVGEVSLYTHMRTYRTKELLSDALDFYEGNQED